MNTESERIKYLRKDILHMTLEKFGESFGVKKSTLSIIENGKSNITDQMRKGICNAYNVSEQWLLTGEGDMFVSQDHRAQLVAWADRFLKDTNDSFRWRFVSLLMSLPEEWWDTLAEKAKEILAEETAAASDQAPALKTYEVQNNFGAVGDGATVINNNDSAKKTEPDN